MKKLRKRDKYVIAAVLNLCWYCIAVTRQCRTA